MIEWVTLHGRAKMDWYEAIGLDKNLGRLPTLNELLYAYKNKVSGFEHTYYWSSDSHSVSNNLALTLHFGTGHMGACFKNNFGHISSRFCKDL
jgi:hypothetical protein